MVDFRAKRVVVTYLCCPEPYPEVHYTMVFKRHSAYYVYFTVLPCVMLAVLSLLVFYLPPDCGEKLTLSITNLLALVVFQQIIAENMPPSEDAPIIGMNNGAFRVPAISSQYTESWTDCTNLSKRAFVHAHQVHTR